MLKSVLSDRSTPREGTSTRDAAVASGRPFVGGTACTGGPCSRGAFPDVGSGSHKLPLLLVFRGFFEVNSGSMCSRKGTSQFSPEIAMGRRPIAKVVESQKVPSYVH